MHHVELLRVGHQRGDGQPLRVDLRRARTEAAHAPEARARAPRRSLGLRETWTEFRRSSGFLNFLAESALWTAPWTGFPPNQDPDYTEDFALSAAVWTDVSFSDGPDGAQALPSSMSLSPDDDAKGGDT